MKKRLLPIILLCLLLAVPLTAGTTAADDDIIASGDCGADGSDVKWSLDTKGNLAITGTGVIHDYNYKPDWSDYAPWKSKRDDILTLTIGEGITVIGTGVFGNLPRLTTATLPDSVVRIKQNAFRGCNNLMKITFPNSVAAIEDSVLWGCSGLVNFTISENVTAIGDNSFRDCERLTKIVIPESVETIGVDAFRECDRLQNVKILGNVSIIKARTFLNCPILEDVTIPGSVEIIDEEAFSGCTALKDIHFAGTESAWKGIIMDAKNEPLQNATVHFGTSAEDTYRINALSIADTDGKALTKIPKSSFLATLSVTNYASSATPIVFLASYDANGQYQGLMYVTVEESAGATAKITLPVDNSGGKIAQLKAFAVNSFADMSMIGNPVSFPA